MKHHIFLFICTLLMGLASCIGSKKSANQRSTIDRPYDPVLEAQRAMARGAKSDALNILNEVIRQDSLHAEAHMRKGSLLYEMGKKKEALKEFELVIQNHPNFDEEMYYSAAIVAMDMEDYDKAAMYYDAYIKNASVSNPKRDKAIKLAAQAKFRSDAARISYEIDLKPLKGDINTSYSEYLPRLTVDGKYMIFTRRVDGQEDLYISMKGRHDTWGVAEQVIDINTPANEGAHSISADGKSIIFTACDRKLGMGSCDLYYSRYEGTGWSKPILLNENVNSIHWDSQPSLSADGRALYFSSARRDGHGGSDIYVCYKDLDGGWTPAQNLGPVVNSSGREESPFIHADGRTLFFRSDGHPGLGSFDIFKTTYDVTTKTWSKPLNLGAPINSENSEGSLSIATNGLLAYYATDNGPDGSLGNLDLFQFTLPDHLRPVSVTYVRAKVTDINTGQAIPATVKLVAKKSASITLEQADDMGEFLVMLYPEEEYVLSVDHPNYTYHLELMSFPTIHDAHTPIDVDIKLTPLSKVNTTESAPIVLQHIYFNTGSAALLSTSEVEISKIASMMRDQPDIHVKIIGHTDNVGTSSDNQTLSEQRAQAVKDALIKDGIPTQRIVAIGLGESQPIAPNDSDAGRKQNRRTEMVIIYP